MSEQFEKVLELEIHFYLNFKQYEQEIYDRLQENEMNIGSILVRNSKLYGG